MANDNAASTPKQFTLTAQKSAAKPATDFQPREFADAVVGKSNCELNNEFQLAQGISKAVSPDALQAAGKPMMYTGLPRPSVNNPHLLMEKSRQLGAFYEKGTELYKTILSEKGISVEKHLANFIVEIHSLTTLVGLRSNQEKIHFIIRSTTGNTPFSMLFEHFIERFYRELRNTHPQFRLFSDFPNAESTFREYLSMTFEACRSGLPHTKEYAIAGWQDDCRYHTGSDPDCCADYCLADIGGMDLRQVILGGLALIGIGNPRTTVPLFLHRHAGILAKLFNDAGHPIQHILALIGPRNSKKTSSAEIVFGTTGTNFTSTPRGMELYAESCHDRTVLIDDLKNAKDKETIRKLEDFLRQYCDSRGRLKSVNGGTELEQVNTRYGVVITGESTLCSLQQSSRTRIIEVPVTADTFSSENLRRFQENLKISQLEKVPSWLDCYDAACIRSYIEPNFTAIVRRIICTKPPPQEWRFARQAESFRNFYALMEIVLDFCQTTGSLSDSIVEDYRAQWTSILVDLMRYNERLCAQDEPFKLFLDAVLQGVQQNLLPMASSREQFRGNASVYSGFQEGGVLAIDAHRAYTYAEKYFRGNGFAATESDVMFALRDNQLLELYNEGNHKSRPFRMVKTTGGVSIKMIFLKMREVERVLFEEKE